MHELRLPLADGTDVAAAHHRADPAGDGLPPVLLLPGARGDHSAPHLVALAELLAAAGHHVVRAALSPLPPGSGFVGPAERSIGRMRDVLAAARELVGDPGGTAGERSGWIVGGASYGGRVASLAVAEAGGRAIDAVGLLLVAYPLHPPGRPERLRVAHWPDVDVPVLMLSGDADPFLTAELLAAHVGDLAGPLTLLTVRGGRHDLTVSARSAPDGRRRTAVESVAEHAEAVRTWAAALPWQGPRDH